MSGEPAVSCRVSPGCAWLELVVSCLAGRGLPEVRFGPGWPARPCDDSGCQKHVQVGAVLAVCRWPCWRRGALGAAGGGG